MKRSTSSKSCCQAVKDALIDLYINVKVRNDTSMIDIQSDDLQHEKQTLQKIDSIDLVEYIKSSVEVLVSLKNEDEQQFLHQKSLSSI